MDPYLAMPAVLGQEKILRDLRHHLRVKKNLLMMMELYISGIGILGLGFPRFGADMCIAIIIIIIIIIIIYLFYSHTLCGQ